jgi:hypothetical protein
LQHLLPVPSGFNADFGYATALKNADDMLNTIIKVVDTNGDGKIQYEGPHYPLAC